MKALLIAAILLMPCVSFSQTSRAKLATAKEGRGSRLLPLNHFFINTLPMPLITESLALSLELIITPKITLIGGFEHETSTYNSNVLRWFYGSNVDLKQDSSFFGGRYFLGSATTSGWYGGGGAKLGEVTTEAYTRNNRDEKKTEKFAGPYAEAGYRFIIGDFTRLSWLGDVQLGYGPGEASVDKDYLGYETVNVGYNVSLDARLGINF